MDSSSSEGAAPCATATLAFSRAALARARLTLPAVAPDICSDAFYGHTCMKQALLDDHLSGVCLTRDNRVLVCSEAEFPTGSPEMVAWWFSAGCVGDAEYELWHPEDHVMGRFTEGWHSKRPASVVGETHDVTERLGKIEASRYRIKFAPSATYGIGAAEMSAAHCEVALTARIATHDPVLGWLDVGHFIHFTLPRRGPRRGFRLLSRFWLFDVDVVDGAALSFARSLVRAVANTTPVRSLAARAIGGGPPVALGRALWTHASEEMRVLAAFLPALHAERGDRRDVAVSPEGP